VILHEQAVEFQRVGNLMLGALRDFHLAWPERILRPVQYVRGIVTASPWIVNTVAISRELGEPRRRHVMPVLQLRCKQIQQKRI